MPTAPLQPCPAPRCPALTSGGYCPAHQVQQEHQRQNWDVRRWYRQVRWKRLRQQVLVEQGYQCADCGGVRLELDVHHRVKHGGNRGAFFARTNLVALCKACHTARTARGE